MRLSMPRCTPAVLLGCIAGSAAMPACAQAGGGESLLIGAGDLVAVHVFREGDLDARLRVKDAGTIALPLIGPVRVAGLSAADAGSQIAERYRQEGFLTHPQVTVFVEESAAEQVAVLGEVARPGTVLVTAPRSLLDVLAAAGGLEKSADRHVTVTTAAGRQTTVFVPNEAREDSVAARLMVVPGDTVLVPRAGIVYVLGDVGRPGGFLMQDDSRITLLQVLALAAGSTKTSNESKARLIRAVNGVPTEVPLHLKARERGKLPDLPLQNDDIVFVPFSFGKNMALGATTIAASASSAVIYAAY